MGQNKKRKAYTLGEAAPEVVRRNLKLIESSGYKVAKALTGKNGAVKLSICTKKGPGQKINLEIRPEKPLPASFKGMPRYMRNAM